MTVQEIKEIMLTVPMIPDMELAVTKTVESLSRFIPFTGDQVDEVKHAIIEACMNAFEHSRSADCRILLVFKVGPCKLTVEIVDHGKGFDPALVEDPKIENKLFKNVRKRGWGLKLMKHLMDEVDIVSNRNGTVVRMVKYADAYRKEALNESV
ncbi:ATP-binding protein [bacterium]|nr:ATP-binding protein [candidate division CSSED10-310 bacterium]